MRHTPPFIRFQGSPGSPGIPTGSPGSPTGSPGSPGSPTGSLGSPGSSGSPGSPGLILVPYHGTIILEILHSLSIYLDVLTGLM